MWIVDVNVDVEVPWLWAARTRLRFPSAKIWCASAGARSVARAWCTRGARWWVLGVLRHYSFGGAIDRSNPVIRLTWRPLRVPVGGGAQDQPEVRQHHTRRTTRGRRLT